MVRKLLIYYLLVSVLLAPLAWSQDRALRPATSKASSVTRQALVIGNAEYEYAGRLLNPTSGSNQSHSLECMFSC